MEYELHEFNQGQAAIAANPELTILWKEILECISKVSEEEIIHSFTTQKRKAKSISEAINKILDKYFVDLGWDRQSPIYKDEALSDKTWTLDFAKGISSKDGKVAGIPIEVVFNHGEAIAWNLIKLSLASENNVQKKFQFSPSVGVYICATKEMKDLGGFDGAIGEYERVLKYLEPLDQKMIKPIIVIGLKAPKTFKIERYPHNHSNKKLRNRSSGKLVKF